MNMFTEGKLRMKWTGQPMHWLMSEYDVSEAKQKTSVPRKRLSPHPLFRIALDVFCHVTLVAGVRRSNQTGQQAGMARVAEVLFEYMCA